MKVIHPSGLVAEAAEVLEPVWEEVVVIGAAALQILLASDVGDSTGTEQATSAMTAAYGTTATRDLDVVVVTPTRDVDVVVGAERADEIVHQLEEAGLEPSQQEFERGFTWIRGDLKVQLVRPFHPFPPGAAATLPSNPALSLLRAEAHTMQIAFNAAPEIARLRCASPAALVALKEAAFGRHTPTGEPVERDYHDVYLIVASRPDDLERSYWAAEPADVRPRVDRAVAALAEGGEATWAAARQHALITGNDNIADHELEIRRVAVFFQRRLERRHAR